MNYRVIIVHSGNINFIIVKSCNFPIILHCTENLLKKYKKTIDLELTLSDI